MMRPTLLLSVLALLLAGCGAPGVGVGEGAAPPDGDWVLADGTGPDGPIELVEGHVPTLSIDGEDWGGTVCNSYGATVQVDGSELTITELMHTEMACMPDEAMRSEAAYLDAFQRAETYDASAGVLVLRGPEVELVYDPVEPEPDADLEGTTWRLDSIVEGAGPDGSVSSVLGEPTLELDGDRLGGDTGCNSFGGDYELDGDRLRVGQIDQTLIGCDDALTSQERHVLGVLQSDPTWAVAGPTLELQADDGRGLTYRTD
jgi:heat shock protein HslJ